MADFLFSKKEKQFQLIIESISTLCSTSNKTLLNKNQNMRRMEQLASKNLIKILFPKAILSHNKYGAPLLNNAKAISLSHSADYLALITSNNTAAIDIQTISPKAFKVQSKFLHHDELKLVQNHENATLLWCAKECLFKIHQKGNLIFSDDLRVHKIEGHKIYCSILKKFYSLNYEIFDGLCVVYYFD